MVLRWTLSPVHEATASEAVIPGDATTFSERNPPSDRSPASGYPAASSLSVTVDPPGPVWLQLPIDAM